MHPLHYCQFPARCSRSAGRPVCDRRAQAGGEPGGEYVAQQLDRIWTKYTGNPPPYGLRNPKIDEKRVLFVCHIDRIATFRKP
jgi:hypothetical protein